MAISTAQQIKVLQLTEAMFGAAPGATFLSMFTDSIATGNSIATLAQTLSGSTVFFGKSYSASLSSSQFASAFISDLVGANASSADKNWASTYIVDEMKAGAVQADIISQLTQLLSSVSSSNSNWGVAATHYNSAMAIKIIDNLVGSNASAANKASAVNYIVEKMASGQTLGNMVDWAITTLSNLSSNDVNWGRAASFFANNIAVSEYYSITKGLNAIDLSTLQLVLKGVTNDASSIATAEAVFTTPLTGKIQDGYLAGATVTVHVPGQPDVTVMTDAQGNFTLPAGVFGTLTATGGTDLTTNLPFTGSFTAPAGSTTVNPLTTLQQSFIDKGQTAAQAQTTVTKALGLDSSQFDLTTFDPLAAAQNPNASAAEQALAAKVQAQAAMVANLMTTASKTLQGAAGAGNLDATSASTAVIGGLINAITNNSVINFSDTTILQNILTDSAANSSNAHLLAAASSVTSMAETFATMSAASADNIQKTVAAGGDITVIMSGIVQAQVVAQGDMANQLLKAAEAGSLNTIQSNFTVAAFNTAAASIDTTATATAAISTAAAATAAALAAAANAAAAADSTNAANAAAAAAANAAAATTAANAAAAAILLAAANAAATVKAAADAAAAATAKAAADAAAAATAKAAADAAADAAAATKNAADLNTQDNLTETVINATAATRIIGTVAEVKTALSSLGISHADNVAVTLTDAAQTNILATDLSVIGAATTGVVTVTNALVINGSAANVTTALVTVASLVVAATATVNITDADTTAITATTLSAVAAKTTGLVTVAHAIVISGSAAEVNAALVNTDTLVLAATAAVAVSDTDTTAISATFLSTLATKTSGPISLWVNELGGTQSALANVTAANKSLSLKNDPAYSSFLNVIGFGADDTLIFSPSANSLLAISSANHDVTLTTNQNGVITSLVLKNILSSDTPIFDVTSFNALPVGDILFTGNYYAVQSKNLDVLGGSLLTPSAIDAANGSFNFADSASIGNVAQINHFAADDSLSFSHASALSVSSQHGDVLVSVNNNGTLSSVTLIGVANQGQIIYDVQSFNALGTGHIYY